jgi:hypothetical protein
MHQIGVVITCPLRLHIQVNIFKHCYVLVNMTTQYQRMHDAVSSLTYRRNIKTGKQWCNYQRSSTSISRTATLSVIGEFHTSHSSTHSQLYGLCVNSHRARAGRHRKRKPFQTSRGGRRFRLVTLVASAVAGDINATGSMPTLSLWRHTRVYTKTAGSGKLRWRQRTGKLQRRRSDDEDDDTGCVATEST